MLCLRAMKAHVEAYRTLLAELLSQKVDSQLLLLTVVMMLVVLHVFAWLSVCMSCICRRSRRM
jgi:hypothetical protein